MIIQTQAQILQSDSLALRVIEDLHLEQTEDYPGEMVAGWLGFRALWGPEAYADSQGRIAGKLTPSADAGAEDLSSPADREAGGRNAPDRRVSI